MKKQTKTFTLSLLAASVAALSVGCASTGYARYDDSDDAVGASAGAEVGGAEAGVSAGVDVDDNDLDVNADADVDNDADLNTTMVDRDQDYSLTSRDATDPDHAASISETALSFSPETRANWVNRFPFYDWHTQVIQTYTFAVPDPDVTVSSSANLPTFNENLEPGSVFVEAAGGSGQVRTGRIIQHSPLPTR